VSEIDFAELKDGTLVELMEDSRNSGQTCLAVWKDGEVRFVDRLEQDGQVFVPLSRKNEILGRLRLPSAAMPYQSVQELLSRVESLISQCVAVDEQYVTLLADFALSTWFVDRVSVAPYLSVVGLTASIGEDYVTKSAELALPAILIDCRHHFAILLSGVRSVHADDSDRRGGIGRQ
jgi:hypothetical protein